MSEFIYGKNPILEALRAERRKISKFFYGGSQRDQDLKEALELCEKRKVKVQEVERKWLEAKAPGATTQGWMAEVSPYPYVELESLIQERGTGAAAVLLALDQIQDPQNLGAILRSAESSGVEGVFFPEDRATPITPAVCKASAGAVEYLPIARVTNLTRSLTLLKEKGFWVVGTAFPEPGKKVEDALHFQWPEKTVLVLGSEGKGLRRLTQESCDFLIHLPMVGRIPSLNVSAAAAVLMYKILQDRRISKK